MCGRYAAAADPAALVEEFDIDEEPAVRLPADFNVAPTKPAYIVTAETDPESGVPAAGGANRALKVARWGLVPSWAKDPSVGSRMINARCETVDQKPSFRSAFARRRCLVPALGYYEWQGAPGAKQPYFIQARDHRTLALAGLFEWWTDRTRAADDPDATRLTFTILTRSAEGSVADIHDRMPVVVQPSLWSAWLDPRSDARQQLQACAVPELSAYPISTAVNSVRNNGPDLIRPQ